MSRRLFYRYLPILSLVFCLGCEYLLRFGSHRLRMFWGVPIFVVWPATLLFWLIYYAIRMPGLKTGSYYLFIFWIFVSLAVLVSAAVVCKLLGVSNREEVYQRLGYLLFGAFWLLAVYQIWACVRAKTIRKKSEDQGSQERNQPDSKKTIGAQIR